MEKYIVRLLHEAEFELINTLVGDIVYVRQVLYIHTMRYQDKYIHTADRNLAMTFDTLDAASEFMKVNDLNIPKPKYGVIVLEKNHNLQW